MKDSRSIATPPKADTDHRALFERAAEHAAAFRDSLADRSPWPLQGPALERRFDGPTPEAGERGEAVIDALADAAEPGLAVNAGPRFFGWVIGAAHPVGVAADMMASAWAQNAGNHFCSPAAAMAERTAARWLLDMLRLPDSSSVGFVTGATMAGFVCLAAGRNEVLRRVGWDVEADGLQGAPRIRVFVGEDAHVTVISALRYLGLGANPTRIATDAEGRMDAEALAVALAAGQGPAIVIGQAGQINTGAFDPFTAIAEVCREHGAWLHIDGAFGLWARAVPELARLTAGIDEADSWSVDGHKWLQLPYDSGFAIVRDANAHRRAMSIAASYLPAAQDDEYDPGQLVPELSRKARGFPAWAMLRFLGRHGVAELVRGHCAMAAALAERLSAEPGVHILNRVDLNQVLVGFGRGSQSRRDALTQAVLAHLKDENECLALGAAWRGGWVMRLSIISADLTPPDIDRLADRILAAWRHVLSNRSI